MQKKKERKKGKNRWIWQATTVIVVRLNEERLCSSLGVSATGDCSLHEIWLCHLLRTNKQALEPRSVRNRDNPEIKTAFLGLL